MKRTKGGVKQGVFRRGRVENGKRLTVGRGNFPKGLNYGLKSWGGPEWRPARGRGKSGRSGL